MNKIDPLQFGEAILYRGEYFDDCARTDDPLGRWKAGDMIELKGPTYHWLLNGLFAMTPWEVLDQADRQNNAISGSGRRDVYLVAEIGAVEDLKFLLQNLDNIDIFHFAPVTPVVPKRPRKSLFLWGDGENGLGQTDDGRCLAAAEHRFVGAHRCAN
ncbi:hypothetical protein [Beijerinckia sp. L45]|uniref:hypothetical protein n=1 Tax=Beijerinckia sp. L45 TaxID=1641855 RepID=UPI00131B5139|nr:hypothetical protein [Beijerinckia sp. L45]